LTIAGAKGLRRLPNWIDSFVEYTSDLPSPEIFRKWAALGAISGALEQRVWIQTMGRPMFPNLYVILVGPPGVGKTVLTREMIEMWQAVEGIHIAPDSVSRASLTDSLADAKRRIVRPADNPPIIEYHSMQILSSELSELIPVFEPSLMSLLQKLYDREPFHAERKRGKDLKHHILHPQATLFAATTPSFLLSMMPEGAWDQGLISRSILVYSGETLLRDLFAEPKGRSGLYDDLRHDLSLIGSDGNYGKIQWEPEAMRLMQSWYERKEETQLLHTKLTHYNTRRHAHLLKLCMITAQSKDKDTFVITVGDFQKSADTLIEAEKYMPDIFKASGSGGDSKSIDETWYFVWERYAKEKKPIQEFRIRRHLSERAPAHSVDRIIKLMAESHILIHAGVDNLGNLWKPAPKQTHNV
jgi:hypothetical protein